MFVGKTGDLVLGGGIVSSGAVTVYVNDLFAAKVGSIITPHDSSPVHKAVMMTGSPTVMVEDLPLCRCLDFATCADVLIPLGIITVEVD